jgi:hypothetical protein
VVHDVAALGYVGRLPERAFEPVGRRGEHDLALVIERRRNSASSVLDLLLFLRHPASRLEVMAALDVKTLRLGDCESGRVWGHFPKAGKRREAGPRDTIADSVSPHGPTLRPAGLSGDLNHAGTHPDRTTEPRPLLSFASDPAPYGIAFRPPRTG